MAKRSASVWMPRSEALSPQYRQQREFHTQESNFGAKALPMKPAHHDFQSIDTLLRGSQLGSEKAIQCRPTTTMENDPRAFQICQRRATLSPRARVRDVAGTRFWNQFAAGYVSGGRSYAWGSKPMPPIRSALLGGWVAYRRRCRIRFSIVF